MKHLIACLPFILFGISITASAQNQHDYKHPHLDGSGQVVDSTGVKLGWIKDGIIYNAKAEQVGKIEKQELFDYKGHRLGRIGKDGTFYDNTGAILFTIETDSKGEKCKVFDANGKVIATVHENYKDQACAFHCLSKNMPSH
jgi:hypothetical protein